MEWPTRTSWSRLGLCTTATTSSPNARIVHASRSTPESPCPPGRSPRRRTSRRSAAPGGASSCDRTTTREPARAPTSRLLLRARSERRDHRALRPPRIERDPTTARAPGAAAPQGATSADGRRFGHRRRRRRASRPRDEPRARSCLARARRARARPYRRGLARPLGNFCLADAELEHAAPGPTLRRRRSRRVRPAGRHRQVPGALRAHVRRSGA